MAELTGVTKINGVPAQCTLRAYRRDTGAFEAEIQSNPITGAYSITVLPNIDYDVICFDGVGICPQASGPFNIQE